MEVQTRSQTGEIRFYNTLESALADAQTDVKVWKVSFNAEDGTRIRLVRTIEGWTYESVMDGNRWTSF